MRMITIFSVEWIWMVIVQNLFFTDHVLCTREGKVFHSGGGGGVSGKVSSNGNPAPPPDYGRRLVEGPGRKDDHLQGLIKNNKQAYFPPIPLEI